MKTISQFIKDTEGKEISNPDGSFKRQCVSLINIFLEDCLGIPFDGRGNAKDLDESYVRLGIAKKVDKAEHGDILVWNPSNDSRVNQKYGHVGMYFNGKLYDQNNGYHDKYKCGYASFMFNNPVILRTIKRPPAEELPEEEKTLEKGLYITNAEMNVRKGPGTSYSRVLVKEMSADGKKNAVSQNSNSFGVYKKGTKFTVLEIEQNKDGSYWGKGYSGWVCLIGSTGVVLCEKEN